MTAARGPRVVLVDLYHGGHHGQYVECLLDYWRDRQLAGELHAVVSERFGEEHGLLISAIEETAGASVHLVPVPPLEQRSLLKNDLLHGRVVAEYASRLDPDQVLLMYFDHVQLSLARNLRLRRPTGISGIYFRPTLHYRAFGLNPGGRDAFVALRKRLVLRAALRNPQLRTLFVLDPYAAEQLARQPGGAEIVHLPEPLRLPPAAEQRPPSTLDHVDPDRRTLLLFGSLDDRKGIRPVLDALAALPKSAQSRLAIVLAGKLVGQERDELRRRISALADASQVQVLLDDRFLAEDEIQPLFAASDLVLLTYDRHVGSSGVLIRAAAAGVPVLSSDYGLLGAQVTRHRLGVTLDATSAEAIGTKLVAWLDDPTTIPLDPDRAAAFAAANTAEAFAETIFSRLVPGS